MSRGCVTTEPLLNFPSLHDDSLLHDLVWARLQLFKSSLFASLAGCLQCQYLQPNRLTMPLLDLPAEIFDQRIHAFVCKVGYLAAARARNVCSRDSSHFGRHT